MTNKTFFLPGLSTKLSGRTKRRQIENLRLLRERAEAASISDVGSLFSEILPPEDLEAAGGDRRKRHFPAVVTFWGRGRDSGCPEPPAQIPAGGTTAPGSYLE